MNDEKKYVLCSPEHQFNPLILCFWYLKGAGYTTDLDKAQRYTVEDISILPFSNRTNYPVFNPEVDKFYEFMKLDDFFISESDLDSEILVIRKVVMRR